MKNKSLIWVALGSALLIGGGIFWWMKNRKNETGDSEEKPVDSTSTQSSQTNTTTATSSLPSTPFKNVAEGNAFRGWMAKNHPDFRYKGQILDTTGSYDNDFMRVAFQSYGAEYIKATTPVSSTTTNNTMKSGDLVYLKGNSAPLYSYPQDLGQYILGKVDKRDFLDKPIGSFVSDAGGFIKFNTIAFQPYDRNKGNFMNLKIEKKVAFIKKMYISDKPY